MRWDPAKSNENVKLEDATATHARNVWDTVQCDTWLSSGVHRITIKTDNVENVGLFLGVVSRDFWSDDAEDEPMRDSPHALCMHGDGRVVSPRVPAALGQPITTASRLTRLFRSAAVHQDKGEGLGARFFSLT